ncbi:uncharacterized protein LOC135395221 [Ornithodoros turicata]|uniref:uncharacterized protein LOC135395221 n=1 Tax=Ornithodoros turicata TaxID=34597 RepID=UPI003139829F
MAVTDQGPRPARLLYVRDRIGNHRCLVDTGAQVSVIPGKPSDKKVRPGLTPALQAANGSTINTYGLRSLTLDIGIRRTFRWPFVVADVEHPILGADFLHFHNLDVSIRQCRLRDNITNLVTVASVSRAQSASICTFIPTSRYEKIFASFPELLKPCNLPAPVKHNVSHRVETTGPPVTGRFRRLSGERLAIARREFEHMLALGIIRPSASNWASSLHMVPKKEGGQ